MHSLRQKLELARNLTLVLGVLSLGLLAIDGTQAEPLSTDNYRLDPNVADSFGGLTDSDQYELVSSGGDAVIGLGDSPSYKLSQGYVSQLEQSIELNVVPEGVHASFPLNTGTGIQAYDISPNNNHGELKGDPQWVDGRNGSQQALEFDGQNDWVNYEGVSTDSEDRTDPATYSAWFKTTNDSDGFMYIVGDFTTANSLNHRSIGVRDGSATLFYYRSDDTEELVSDIAVADGEWYHIAGYISSDLRILYVNGEEVERSEESLDETRSRPGDAAIGVRNTSSQAGFFEGSIDQVRIDDGQLSGDEINDLYAATSSGATSALTLPRLEPAEDESVAADAVVRTDAGGYNIAIDQDGDLRTEQGDTIAGVDGSIEFPASWQSDTTGFGFTVRDAVQRDGKWGSDPDFEYAAVPDSTTTFHTRDGLSGGDKEVTELEFRVGIDGTQAAGIYRNRLGFTATLKP